MAEFELWCDFFEDDKIEVPDGFTISNVVRVAYVNSSGGWHVTAWREVEV